MSPDEKTPERAVRDAADRAPERASPSGPSLWERFGRGVGKGWRKARAVGSRLGSEAGVYLDRQRAEEALDGRYRVLGRVVAEQILDWDKGSVSAEDPGVRQLLEEIRAGREELERLERQVRERDERDERDESTEPGGADP